MAKPEDLVIKIRVDDGQLDSGLGKAERKLGDFGRVGKKLVGLIGGAFAVENIARFTMEITRLGGELNGVREAFQRIATVQDLKEMQEATKGTVSELELMKRTVMANNLGVPIEKLAQLFEFAAKRAQDTGESVDYLVNSIVTGIGRKSPLILDNLGISSVQLKEKLKGIGIETASVAEIAAAVSEIAAESMKKTGTIADNSRTKTLQAKAAWDDLKAAWGESIGESTTLAKTIDTLTNSIKLQSDQLSFWEKWWYRNTMQFSKGAEIAAERSQKQAEQQQAAAAAIDGYNQMIEQGKNPLKETTEIEEKKEKTIGELRAEVIKLKADLEGYTKSQFRERQATILQIDATEKLIKSLTRLHVARVETPDMMKTRGETPQIGDSMTDMPGLETDKLEAYGASYIEKYRQIMADVQEEVDALNQAANEAIVTGIVGGLEAGLNGANFGGVMRALLSPLAGILEEQGKMMILSGKAIEIFKASFGSLNGLPAIVAGASLIALAQGMKALGNIGSAPGGGSYGATGGGITGYDPSKSNWMGQTPQMSIELKGELIQRGDDMVYNVEKNDYKISRLIGH